MFTMSCLPSVSLSRLPPVSSCHTGLERSMLRFSSEDRLGLNRGISTYLSEHGASIRACTERLLDVDRIFGSSYILEAPEQAMRTIDMDDLKEISQHCAPSITTQQRHYQLTVVAPDRPGILAAIDDVLFKRKVSILANDTVTFTTELSEKMGGSGTEIRVASASMLLGLEASHHDEVLDSLKDGLEYLEHRYHWYIRLEGKRKRRALSNLPVDIMSMLTLPNQLQN
jgi:predicted amino acid-binding ACT domain protein